MTTTTATTARTITRALRSIWPAGVRVSTTVTDTTVTITAPNNLHGASSHEHIRRTVAEATGQLWVFDRLEPIAPRGNGRFARYHLHRPQRPLRATIVAVEWYDTQDRKIRRGEVIDSNTTTVTVRWPNGRDEKISRRDFRDDQRFVLDTDTDAIPAPRTPEERAAADAAFTEAFREVTTASFPFLDRRGEQEQIEADHDAKPGLLDSAGSRTPKWCAAVAAALRARAAEIDAVVAEFKVGDEVTQHGDDTNTIWTIREVRTSTRDGDVWLSVVRTSDDGTEIRSGGRARSYDLHRAATGATYVHGEKISDQALQDLWLLYEAGYLRDGASYAGHTLIGGFATDELQVAGYANYNVRLRQWEITDAGAEEIHRIGNVIELARAYHRTDSGDVTVVVLLSNLRVEIHTQYCDRPDGHVSRTVYDTLSQAEAAYNHAVALFKPVPAQVESAMPMGDVVAMAAGTNDKGQHHFVTQTADNCVEVAVYSVSGLLVSSTTLRFDTAEEATLRYQAETGTNPLADGAVHPLNKEQREALLLLLVEHASLSDLAREGVSAIALDYLVACRLVRTDRRYRRIQISDAGIRALRATSPNRFREVVAIAHNNALIIHRRRGDIPPTSTTRQRFDAAVADLAAAGITFTLGADRSSHAWCGLSGARWHSDTLLVARTAGTRSAVDRLEASCAVDWPDVARAVVKAFAAAGFTTAWSGRTNDVVEINLT